MSGHTATARIDARLCLQEGQRRRGIVGKVTRGRGREVATAGREPTVVVANRRNPATCEPVCQHQEGLVPHEFLVTILRPTPGRQHCRRRQGVRGDRGYEDRPGQFMAPTGRNHHVANFIGKRRAWILRPILNDGGAELDALERGLQLKRALKEGPAIRIPLGGQQQGRGSRDGKPPRRGTFYFRFCRKHLQGTHALGGNVDDRRGLPLALRQHNRDPQEVSGGKGHFAIVLNSARRGPDVGPPLEIKFDWRQCRQRHRPFDESKSPARWFARPKFHSPSDPRRRHLKDQGIPFDADLLRGSIKETEIRDGDHHLRRRFLISRRKNIQLQEDVALRDGHRAGPRTCEIIEEIVEEIGAGRRHGLDQDPEHNDQPESDLIDAAPET